MRSLGISVISLALTSVVIVNAYYQKKQFYPSVVYITKSNPSMAVIYIQAFIIVLLLGKLMRKVFFGQLRTAEFEHLMERAWYAITETCLAFTVFRDDFNPKFVALFTLLLFLKSFHWLAEDRVDYMERSPVISWLFHIRVLSLLLVLGALDLHFVEHAYLSTVTKGASVQLVFGFEYAILITMVINIGIKYALHTVDLNSETPWENKAVFLLYTELIMGLIKVILYVAFVAIMVRIYTLPLFAFRPMYYTIRNFKKAFNDVILSRRAIHNMNTLYPDATPEELEAADNVCIICREEMTTASKKLPCNHIFHTACLRSWFQRQQTCPTCRLNILRTTAPVPTPQPRPEQRPRAQPQQMPPNPFINPFMGPNPFVNMNAFAGGNPFQQLLNQNGPNQNVPAQGPAAAQQGAPSTTPGTSGQSNSQTSQNEPTNNQQPAGIPPFSFPPFPFLPFMTPPPLPTQNLRSLTLDELRRMEGNERENVEVRIQCLRNIQIMLDAAVLMMQQYSTAAALSTSIASAAQPNGAAAAENSANPANPASNNSETKTSPQEAHVINSTFNTSNNVATNTSAADAGSTSSDAKNSEPSSSSTAETPAPSSNADEELRRRRLQRFQQPVEQQQ